MNSHFVDDFTIEETHREKKFMEHLDQIRESILREYDLDAVKWSELLCKFIYQAIDTVKPMSDLFEDSIDINQYIKISLVNYRNTEKSEYVNGVIIKKSIAHSRMFRNIEDPKILLLSNSLGMMQEE